MKLLVLSDSHGSTDFLEKALSRTRDADIIIHLGDGADDLDMMRQYTGDKLTYQCNGNMDYYLTFTDRCIFSAEDVTVFATHGHLYNVKSGLLSLYLAARERKAKICLYGHTHIAHAERENDMLILNPGSIRKGDYAVITIHDGSVFYELKQI